MNNIELDEEQLNKYHSLTFGWNEYQIDDDQYKQGLLEFLPKTHIRDYYVLTGMFPGHKARVIEVVNVSNIIGEEEDD